MLMDDWCIMTAYHSIETVNYTGKTAQYKLQRQRWTPTVYGQMDKHDDTICKYFSTCAKKRTPHRQYKLTEKQTNRG